MLEWLKDNTKHCNNEGTDLITEKIYISCWLCLKMCQAMVETPQKFNCKLQFKLETYITHEIEMGGNRGKCSNFSMYFTAI